MIHTGFPSSLFPGKSNTGTARKGYPSPYENISENYNPSAGELNPHLFDPELAAQAQEQSPPMAYGGCYMQAFGARQQQQQSMQYQPRQRQPLSVVNYNNVSNRHSTLLQSYPYTAPAIYRRNMGHNPGPIQYQPQHQLQYQPQHQTQHQPVRQGHVVRPLPTPLWEYPHLLGDAQFVGARGPAVSSNGYGNFQHRSPKYNFPGNTQAYGGFISQAPRNAPVLHQSYGQFAPQPLLVQIQHVKTQSVHAQTVHLRPIQAQPVQTQYAQTQPTIHHVPQVLPTPPSSLPPPPEVHDLTSEPQSTLQTPKSGPDVITEPSKKRKRSFAWLMDADKAKNQKTRRDRAWWLKKEAERLVTLNESRLDDETQAKVDNFVKRANEIFDELREEDQKVEQTEGKKTVQSLKKARQGYEERFKYESIRQDDEWRQMRRERNLRSRGRGAQAKAEKERREQREKFKEARAKRSQSHSEPIQAIPKTAEITPQPAPGPQSMPDEDLGLFGMGNDIFNLPAAMFAPTSCRVARSQAVLPRPSIKQVESVKETKSTPAPPSDHQDKMGLLEDNGLDDLFENDGSDNVETSPEETLRTRKRSPKGLEDENQDENQESEEGNQDEGVKELQNPAIAALKEVIAEYEGLHEAQPNSLLKERFKNRKENLEKELNLTKAA